MRFARLRIDPYFLAGLIPAAVGGGLLVARSSASAPTALDTFPPGLLSGLDTATTPYRLGAAGRPVQVVEVFDYQCPACAEAHAATKASLASYVDRGLASYLVYDVPLPTHGNSYPAAIMARCVHRADPDVFWRFRDAVLARQGDWTSSYPVEPVLLGIAAGAGADTAAVQDCIRENGSAEMRRLRAARTLMGEAGIGFTPVWLVNGKVVRWDQLGREIEQAAAGRQAADHEQRKPSMRISLRLFALAAALFTACTAPAAAQTSPPRIRVLGDADRVTLFDLRAAAFNGSDLAVVTKPEPGVHLFSGRDYRAFGKKGGGPAEFENPQDAAWAGGHILVTDFRGSNNRILSFDPSGRFLGSRSTAACGMARGIQISGPDTLLTAIDMMGARRAIVRLLGARCDTIIRYTLPKQIQLTAQGSPSLTVSDPFAPGIRWTALPGRRIAFWDAINPYLIIFDVQGRRVGQMPLPRTRFQVNQRDREWWFSREIPGDFMGQKVFEPLRRKAREEMKFPTHFPLALALVPNPQGGVWVQRTTSGTGQVWTLVERSGERVSFKLPAGRELLAVGQSEIAVKARDELDVEVVEVYRKPPG